MYKEYRFPMQDEQKASKKIYDLEKTYGYKFPAYKIQTPNGKEWIAIVHPVGLEPKPKKQGSHQLF